MFVRRLALVFSIVVTGLLAVAAGAMAAGGGLGPGDYTFTSTSASAYFGGGAKGGPPQPTFSVYVNHGLNSFEPQKQDGPESVVDSTLVYFSEWDASGNGGFGCFIIPAADFTVSKNLQSGALHTTLTSASTCPGIGKPLAAGKQAGPFAGGGGGGLVLPIKVDITWSGAGVVSTFRDEFSFKCKDRVENGSNSYRDSVGASASGSTSALSGQFTTTAADVSSADSQLEIKGTVRPPCFG